MDSWRQPVLTVCSYLDISNVVGIQRDTQVTSHVYGQEYVVMVRSVHDLMVSSCDGSLHQRFHLDWSSADKCAHARINARVHQRIPINSHVRQLHRFLKDSRTV